ncbi:MAG: hypothetical protein N2053_04965, partial [Chitinispirillaceae bacterium]|nr:hypothetical protein [Chitinispirillaceae bacterium]
FRSQNKHSAYYGGKDGCGTVALQIRIPKFGFISTGPLIYLIKGENRSYNGEYGYYYNVNNIRGWIAIDYFPPLSELTKNRPYVSIEASLSPQATYSKRIFAQEFSISISIGAITKRLYGVESDVDWSP